MRKLVPALAITTVAFAGSTIYLARELRIERARSAAAPRPAGPANAQVEEAPLKARGTPATSAGQTATPGASGAPAAVINGNLITEAEVKRMQAEYSRNLLAQIADPDRREEMLAEHRMTMRNGYPRVDKVLGLTPDEYARFLDLSAREMLRMQEAGARCLLDPAACPSDDETRGTDAVDQLLGADRAAKLEVYKNTMGEREAVSQLRSRLPDALRLDDDKAEALITALAEERELIHREAAQRGQDINGFNIGAGMLFAPSQGGSLEERLDVARRNSQRLRDRAAQFLDAEQRRAFDEMQDETLLGLRRLLRGKDGAPTSYVDAVGPTS